MNRQPDRGIALVTGANRGIGLEKLLKAGLVPREGAGPNTRYRFASPTARFRAT